MLSVGWQFAQLVAAGCTAQHTLEKASEMLGCNE